MWLRLRQIALVAPELAPVEEDLREIFGLELCHRDPGLARFGLENSLWPLGNNFIEVVAPIEEGSAGGRYLERRGGAGGYMVITQCDDHAPRKKRVAELGIRLVADSDRGEFANMQLHPKDTGGSFFEIDEQRGPRGYDEDGPWGAVGGDGWQEHRRLERVRAIRAVEMQCDDPRAVAARWSDIAELPVVETGAGRYEIGLQNAVLRFAPITDGRPEGLSGLDIEVADREAVLASAKARGAYRSDEMVEFCGMRWRLVSTSESEVRRR